VDLHQFSGLLGLAFAIFHGAILLGDRYMGYTPLQLLLPFASLDYRPLAVGLGQVFVSAFCFALFELLVLLGAALVTGSIRGSWIATALVVIIPTAWATAALENLVYLLLPYRVSADGRAGAQFLGKALVLMMLKLFTLSLLAGMGFASWWGLRLVGVPQLPAVLGAGVVMALPALPLTWLVGRAFARFDFTHDAAVG
jgi:hypothetical protein